MRRLLCALVLCVACTDSRNPLAPPARVPSQRALLAVLSCAATIPRPGVITGFTCTPAHVHTTATGARSTHAEDVIVGRQNVDVTLKFTGTTFGSSLVSTNVTVTNLLSQPMGTTDGVTTTATGTEVFFLSGPTVTNGSGLSQSVSIANADGTCNCTNFMQSYFKYTPFIPAGGTSAAKAWQFNVSAVFGSIESFTFQVEIDAALPAEASARRWTVLRQGLTGSSVNGVWEHTPTDIYAVGNATGSTNTILHNDGTGWSFVNTGLSLPFGYQSVYGVSGTDLWTVGGGALNLFTVADDGEIWRNTGIWGAMTSGTSGALYAINGSSTTDVWSVGAAGTVLHFDGTTWTTQTSGVATALRGVYAAVPGTAVADVYAVGDNGVVLHTNGASSASWLAMPAPAAVSTNQFLTVFGTSTTNVYVGGANGVVMVGTQ
jgi:hypothetical protein